MESQELEYYLALYFIPNIGARRLFSLTEFFGTPSKAFFASARELGRVPGMGASTIEATIAGKEEALVRSKAQLKQRSGSREILTRFDPEYPVLLSRIYDPPALLFIEGNKALLADEKKIAIVGTRKVTEYGRRITDSICTELAAEGATIVSGFARGVDTIAHTTTAASGGRTIAVLGSGLDIIYPTSNKRFASELITSDGGLLVSELPFGTPPDARNFPWRNRIVSGLSVATVIVESDEKGGSMITAAIALDQNREVFAIPGDISRQTSAGSNLLIRESRARLARDSTDILVDLGWRTSTRKRPSKHDNIRSELSLIEACIVDVLQTVGEPVHIDRLSELTELEIRDILVQLLNLELKGIIRQMAGRQFILLE